MSLESVLQYLDNAQIVRRSIDNDAEYLFKHSLLQDATYQTLLQKQRREIHRSVARAYEEQYPDRLDDYAAILARHFEAANDPAKTLEYATRAGDAASRRYALPEAVSHYTQALSVSPRNQPLPTRLYRARGLAYESLGEFELARLDQVAALESARTTSDHQAEWQALLDLGLLWAGRDYKLTGEYYQRAFELARQIGDRATLAHSLNRVGNWDLNVDRPVEARQCHEQALQIFQELQDERGIAETLDFLGITSSLGSNPLKAADYFKHAIPLLRKLDDRQRLASALSTLGLLTANVELNTMVLHLQPLKEGEQWVQEAVRISQDIGVRSSEAFALDVLATSQCARGEFDQALFSVQRALAISEEIAHRQWMLYAHSIFGTIYNDLFDLERAYQHLVQALALAKESGSWHWIRVAAAVLASTHLLRNEPAKAKDVLDDALEADTVPQTLGQRLVYCSRVELALAQGHPEDALVLIDQLIASAPNAEREGRNILRVSMLRGQALAALGEFAGAETSLLAAQEMALAHGALVMLVKTLKALGRVYRSEGRLEQAASVEGSAESITQELAAHLADETMRPRFIAGMLNSEQVLRSI